MGYYEKQITTISCDYPEYIEINEALAMFAKSLWEEGYINILTKYDKETGLIIRDLSIEASKNICKR